MTNILVVCPQAWDGTSFFRGALPFGQLRRLDPNISVTLMENIEWCDLALFDLVVLQRPCHGDHLEVGLKARDMGLPVWVDYDDNLFQVPCEHTHYAFYLDQDTRKNIIDATKLANVVTVSTPALMTLYGAYNPNTHVIPNAIPDHMLNIDKILQKTEPPKPIVYWRGSVLHMRDLLSVREQIIEVDKAIPDITWRFCGYNPWFITECVKNAEFVKAQETLKYFKWIQDQAYTVSFHPLIDTLWNHAKSNIAWIEATLSATPFIGPWSPSFTEWQHPGISTFKTIPDFSETLKRLLSSKELRNDLVKESIEEIRTKRLLSHTNHQRLTLLQSFM